MTFSTAASIEPATPSDMAAIKALLDASGLPTADLGATAWTGFLVLRQNGGVRGVVGLETSGPVGLLRSLAIVEE